MSAEILSSRAEVRGSVVRRASVPGWTAHPWAPGESGPALFTVDVEDYFHVSAFERVVRRSDWDWYPSRIEANVARLLDLCDEYGVRGTWFVLGWEAEKRPAMVRRIAERGHEVGCHSFWHREVFTLDPKEFREDTLRAKRAIEDAAGVPVLGYRAPSFSITEASLWALEILEQLGFVYDSSIFPVRHPRYGIPGAPVAPNRVRCGNGGRLWELPPATVGVLGSRIPIAGGGYLRQFPAALMRAGLQRLVRSERLPAVLYVHPWEIDPAQPRLASGLVTRIRHYRNLGAAEPRLRRLLRDHSFTRCADLIGGLEVQSQQAAAIDVGAVAVAGTSVADGLVGRGGNQPDEVERQWLDGFGKWGRGWLHVLGSSMLPTLRPGDRILVESTRSTLAPGEIGVFLSGRRLVVHRVLAAFGTEEGSRYLESGDGAHEWALRPQDALVGRVTAIERDGVRRPLGPVSLTARLTGTIRTALGGGRET